MEEHAVREWLGFEIEISKLLNFSDISALLDKFPWMCYFPLGNVYKKFTDLYQALHKSLTAEINKSKVSCALLKIYHEIYHFSLKHYPLFHEDYVLMPVIH